MPKDTSITDVVSGRMRRRQLEKAESKGAKRGGGRKSSTPTRRKAPASSFAPSGSTQRTFGAPLTSDSDKLARQRNAQSTDSNN